MRRLSKNLLTLGLLFTAGLLAACGTDPKDRVQGGAAAGAATGAGIGILGGPIGVLVGGVIGGGAGALTGATVPAKDVNAGPPPWSKSN